MTDAGFQEIIFHGPLHQIIVDRRASYSLIVLNCLVIIAFESGQIGYFEVMLVCETSSHSEEKQSAKKKDFRNMQLRRRQREGGDGKCIRFGIISLKPVCSLFVRIESPLHIT